MPPPGAEREAGVGRRRHALERRRREVGVRDGDAIGPRPEPVGGEASAAIGRHPAHRHRRRRHLDARRRHRRPAIVDDVAGELALGAAQRHVERARAPTATPPASPAGSRPRAPSASARAPRARSTTRRAHRSSPASRPRRLSSAPPTRVAVIVDDAPAHLDAAAEHHGHLQLGAGDDVQRLRGAAREVGMGGRHDQLARPAARSRGRRPCRRCETASAPARATRPRGTGGGKGSGPRRMPSSPDGSTRAACAAAALADDAVIAIGVPSGDSPDTSTAAPATGCALLVEHAPLDGGAGIEPHLDGGRRLADAQRPRLGRVEPLGVRADDVAARQHRHEREVALVVGRRRARQRRAVGLGERDLAAGDRRARRARAACPPPTSPAASSTVTTPVPPSPVVTMTPSRYAASLSRTGAQRVAPLGQPGEAERAVGPRLGRPRPRRAGDGDLDLARRRPVRAHQPFERQPPRQRQSRARPAAARRRRAPRRRTRRPRRAAAPAPPPPRRST